MKIYDGLNDNEAEFPDNWKLELCIGVELEGKLSMIDNISVVMPTYNAMPFLMEAVESVLAQTFGSFEFLIVNDGSTDDSATYLNSLIDPRIRIIHQWNQGIVAALNTGIREAKYEWIARMDADDVALPQRFERELEILECNPQYALVSCAFGYIGARGRRLKATHVHRLRHPPSYNPMVDLPILHQGALYKREAVMTVGGYKEVTAAEDIDLWLRLNEAGYPMVSIPDILMLVRVLPAGISARNFIEQRMNTDYVYACSQARRSGNKEPCHEEFIRTHWPRGWKRLRIEGARQFRFAGASWGANNYLVALARFFLSLLFTPDHVASKFRIYFCNVKQC